MIITKVIIIFLIFIFFYDILIQRPFKRFFYYKLAKKCSEKKNKKLLVIGCPSSGGLSSKIYNYKCGDITVDINTCDCENNIKLDITKGFKNFKENSCVVFISAVLEYIEPSKMHFVLSELNRISGGDLYVVPINNIIDNIIPNFGSYYQNNEFLIRKNKIIKSPPFYNYIEYISYQ